MVVNTKKVTKKRKSQAVETVKKEDSELDTDPAQKKKKKVVRKRKTAEEKQAEAMPLAARTVGHKLYIGAHVSGAGGVHNAVLNSHHIGANAFALFLKSQRKWANPPLLDDVCTSFHSNCGSHTYDQAKYVVPHGSYLVNLAHTDKTRTEQAYDSFLDDLKRCERLGIVYYNFHPGTNSSGVDRPTAIRHLASNINRAHKETSSVITLLENMAHGGNVLGSTFEDLRDIIALINDKSRVGVCLDTCHAFAGGYDLRTPFAFNDTMSKFHELVGTNYLRAVHMNDSKAPFASHKDLHANIGTGFLGLRTFHNIVNDARFEGLPLILETPIEARDDDGVLLKDEKGKEKEDKGVWAREIKLLESLVGMDTESEEFLGLEAQLARKGRKERERIEGQMERKREKDAAKADRAAKKGQKGVGKKKKKASDESEESELSELDDGAESAG
ncbi:xylose isomerase-like protein [Neohortaea acidophila]|uniref:Apurinic-apyrimidinic endonuclease 1 n=1 Tax=Neohortaea acidophila TaxID=245834 RepID=A0A6A6Q7X3_9PEZI|nr:xylose isomerase-like protein [Neohortaea acidophila]KAF2487477.1 xylose isomerase-like protein [Neohortaea acidophila]